MPERPSSSEGHRYAVAVARVNDLRIFYRAAGLDDNKDAGLSQNAGE